MNCPAPLRADPSQDLWAFGCVLYHLCSGTPLFLANDEDNLNQENLQRLIRWNDGNEKKRRLTEILDPQARNLVSILLSFDPSRRHKTMGHVLAHSFFSNKNVGRMLGDAASFDVFISYRVDSDALLVEKLYEILIAKGQSLISKAS